ncbi:hypothetical protein [Clostridium sp.]
MSPFVETLRRLYFTSKITIDKLENLLSETRITQGEYDYIIA